MSLCFKLSAAGNDFLALVEPAAEPAAGLIRAWCSRGLSLGADGLFTLRRTPTGVAMRHYNSDGGAAELCLNASRCAARLAFDLGWAAGEVEIETGAGRVRAHRAGPTSVRTDLPPPATAPRSQHLQLGARRIAGFSIDVGVPHFVVPWRRSLATAPLSELGPRLRSHPAFGAAGTNVDFVRFPEPQRLEIRSFERGVEAETLACGTGVLAAVVVGLALERSRLPLRALTRGGFFLEVGGTAEAGRPLRWSLAGDARLLWRGEPSPEAQALPPPATWS